MKKSIVATIALSLFLSPLTTHADVTEGEIYYGTIAEVADDSLLIKYGSPGGDIFYECEIDSLNCEQTDSTRLLPSKVYTGTITRSPEGNYAVETVRKPGTSMVVYKVHEIVNGKLKQKDTIPYSLNVNSVSFSRDESRVILDIGGGSYALYDIEDDKLYPIQTLPITPFRLVSFSGNGEYVGAYSDSLGKYGFVNLLTGKTATYASGYGSLVELSNDGNYAAVLIQNTSGNHELRILDLNSFPTITVKSSKVNKGKVVTDYLFSGNDLFYMANDTSPLMWKLVRVNPKSLKKTTVADNASYGDYIKSIGDNLFYLKQDGKVRNVYRYSLKTSRSEKTSGTPVSETPNLSRKEVNIAGTHGALIEPANANGKSLPLIIWMHGGPQRQTSIGYHPYLSYAVYDEILEKMVESGARVYKIDYTGSWGYGSSYINALRDKVGVIEMQDIKKSIEALKKAHSTSEVYLMGNSYGGYTALKGSTDFPTLVDGTVAIAAVTDWYNLIYEIPGSPFTAQFGGKPTDPGTQAKYRAASVIKDLQKLDSDPIVLIYGSNDTTVPPRQSRQFLSIAKATKKTNIRGVELQGEDHVIKYRSSLDKLCEETVKTFGFESNICE